MDAGNREGKPEICLPPPPKKKIKIERKKEIYTKYLYPKFRVFKNE
jgi:hypothetical protein